MSLFPQSVAYSSTSSRGLFPSPPAVVQVVVVQHVVPEYFNGHAGSADKVF